MPHARRVMDRVELDTIQKLHDDFKEAIDGTAGKTIPEDESRSGTAMSGAGGRQSAPGGLKSFSNALRSKLTKQLQGIGSNKGTTEMQSVAEEEEDN